MSGQLLDTDGGAPTPPKGKNGAAMVMLGSKGGTPCGGPSANVYPIAAKITTATTATLTPPVANLRLRKLVFSVTENATLAASGIVQITFTLNGTVIFSEGFFVPASATGQAGVAHHRDIPFDMLDLNAGAGALVCTLSTAMTGGQMDVNAFFGD